MQRFPRFGRILARRPRPASILAAGAALVILGGLGTLGASDATPADFVPKSDRTIAWVDGWADGQADVLGDDNRDGIVDEDESGWNCAAMGNRECGPGVPPQCEGETEFADLCATVATRQAYAWTDADGTPHAVATGRELLSRIDAVPGTDEFAAALFALDTQWVQNNEN